MCDGETTGQAFPAGLRRPLCVYLRLAMSAISVAAVASFVPPGAIAAPLPVSPMQDDWEGVLIGTNEMLVEHAPGERLTRGGAEAMVLAATAAYMLGGQASEEWGKLIYWHDTPGRQAYDIVTEMHNGGFSRLLRLAEAVGPVERETKRSVRWQDIASTLEAAAGRDAERLNWRGTATALRMLALWRSRMSPNERLEQVQLISAAPEATKRALVEAIVSADGPYADRARRQYYGLLQQALSAGKLQDPVLAEMLARVAPNPRAAATAAQRLAHTAPAAAQSIARTQVQTAGGSPEAVCQAATALGRTGRSDEALELLRSAEGRFGYPGRRLIRQKLFALLRTPARPPVSMGPPRPVGRGRDPFDPYPQLAEEKARREKAAGVSAGEQQFALGDLFSFVGDQQRASTCYADAFAAADGLPMRCSAWQAWAPHDPEGAWAEAAPLHDVLAAAGNGEQFTALAGMAVPMAMAAGVASGDGDAAVAWARGKLQGLHDTQRTRSAKGFILVWCATAGDPDGSSLLGDDDLDDTSVLDSIGTLTGQMGSSTTYPLTGAKTLDQACVAAIRRRLRDGNTWGLAARLAIEAIPRFHRPRSTAAAWRFVVAGNSSTQTTSAGSRPRENLSEGVGAAADGAGVTEREQKALRQQLTEVALARLAADQDDTFLGRDLLQAAGMVLHQPDAQIALPNSHTLVHGVLKQLPLRHLDANRAARELRSYVNAFRAAEWPPEHVADTRRMLLEACPDSPAISQLAAQLAGAEKEAAGQ